MKFCFFGNISGALKGKTLGGAELQIALLAKALACKGHEVVIIDPSSSESFTTEEGIKLINIPGWNKGRKGLRLFLNRIPALRKALTDQKADYYYVRMRTYFHLLTYNVARKLGSKFIVGLAHDIDVLSIRKKIKYKYSHNFNLFSFFTLQLPNDLVFHYLLKRADYITIQHTGQKVNQGAIKGKVVLFPNIIDISNFPHIENPSRDYFIHVGTLTMIKGVQNLFQLVNKLDKSNTIVIVGEAGDEKSSQILKEIIKNKNIVFRGGLSHKETIEMIANSKALINTSNYEGFPNIFLEAWATCVPVISLKVNPGNVFNKYDLGVCCEGDLGGMKKCMESGAMDSIDKGKLSKYVTDFHSYATAADRFLSLIH
ncbi:MAG TPA: glycosyltransferase [Chitinophagaceae bacterium]|nr:glycosyltransferase [Chitinophagaceae bacterium]